jgi:hypothetical protein
MRSSFVSALAAISLIAAPTASVASAGGASALSIAGNPEVRAAAGVQDANRLDQTGWIIVGVAAVAALIIFFVLIDDDDDDDSFSP